MTLFHHFSYLLVLWLKALLLQLLTDKINEDIQLKNIEVSSFSSDHMSILFFKRVHTDKCKKKRVKKNRLICLIRLLFLKDNNSIYFSVIQIPGLISKS
jgi:hypothetical protein